MARTGLVAVQRQVQRDGKTFTQTVWIKPHHESKVDRQKTIETPKWDFKTADEVKNEVARINGLFDRSERLVLKEELLHHIEHDMGVKWDKVPANEPKAFGRNCLRAFSAAKKHVGSGGAKPQASNPTPTATQPAATTGSKTFEITKQPGKKKLMERPDSRTLARAMRDEHGADVIMQAMRDNGLTWDEVPDAGPNKMRAMRALATFIRYGGELKPSDKAPAPVAADPTPAPEPEPEPEPEVTSKYEKDSIMYDFEQASDLHKAIALSTGILPTDEQSGKYLLEQIQNGKMGTMENPLVDENFGIAQSLAKDINQSVEFVERYQGTQHDPVSRFGSHADTFLTDQFKDTEYEADYEKFVDTFDELKSSFNTSAAKMILSNGANVVAPDHNLNETLNNMNPDWLDLTGEELLTEYKKHIVKAIQNNDDKAFDALGLVEGTSIFANGSRLPLARVLKLANKNRDSDFRVAEFYAELSTDFIKNKTGKSDGWDAINSGKVTKKELAVILLRTIDDVTTNSRQVSTQTIREMTTEHGSFSKKVFDSVKFMPSTTKGERIPENLTREKMELANRSGNFVKSPEMKPFVFNLSVRLIADDMLTNKIGLISKSDFANGNSSAMHVRMETAVKKRKTPELQEKARNKLLLDIQSASTGYNNTLIHKKLKDGEDVDPSLFPSEEEKAKNSIKTSISTVEGSERSVVEKKVQSTHDRSNHASFETKVLGVYRVKRIASEDKFQEINDKINTTGFYYHGTSIETSQKILGESGGFKVFTNKDGNKIKAGSMLGYGIYLASESSKSVQYIGHSFGRETQRGTLFLCKASLGNVVQTRYRGADYNQKIMDDSKTDTVFMDKPDVVNPEWAVKQAEQAVPRLIIDVERVQK